MDPISCNNVSEIYIRKIKQIRTKFFSLFLIPLSLSTPIFVSLPSLLHFLRAQTKPMESGGRRSPPQSMESCDEVATEAVSDPVLSLSDKDMQEKIERLTSFLSGSGFSSLPDKGRRIRVQLQHLKEEQERRRHQPVRVVNEVLPKKEFLSFFFLFDMEIRVLIYYH